MSEKPICATCRHAVFATVGDPEGQCRRYAPRPDAEAGCGQTVWPFVEHDDWCGEWERRR